METSAYKQNSRGITPGETVKVANSQEPVVAIPVTVPPIQVQVPLRAILVEIRHVAVAVDLSDGALCERSSITPPLDSPPVSGDCELSGLNLTRDLQLHITVIT